jgi:ferredoxin
MDDHLRRTSLGPFLLEVSGRTNPRTNPTSYGRPSVRPRPRPVPVLQETRCSSCGICAAVCGFEAITMDDTPTIDEARCSSCGACVIECPEEALSWPSQSG